MILKLIRPTNDYEKQVMQYKADMILNNDSFDGCAGLEETNSFSEWIDFDNRLKKNRSLFQSNLSDELRCVLDAWLSDATEVKSACSNSTSCMAKAFGSDAALFVASAFSACSTFGAVLTDV